MLNARQVHVTSCVPDCWRPLRKVSQRPPITNVAKGYTWPTLEQRNADGHQVSQGPEIYTSQSAIVPPPVPPPPAAPPIPKAKASVDPWSTFVPPAEPAVPKAGSSPFGVPAGPPTPGCAQSAEHAAQLEGPHQSEHTMHKVGEALTG